MKPEPGETKRVRAIGLDKFHIFPDKKSHQVKVGYTVNYSPKGVLYRVNTIDTEKSYIAFVYNSEFEE